MFPVRTYPRLIPISGPRARDALRDVGESLFYITVSCFPAVSDTLELGYASKGQKSPRPSFDAFRVLRKFQFCKACAIFFSKPFSIPFP